jgi:transcriptional regulator with XRE-family HTH domain
VEKISKKLRDALAARPESLRQIAETVEMDHSQLSRFLRGERTITQGSIDKLGLYLGLELKPPAPVKKKPKN